MNGAIVIPCSNETRKKVRTITNIMALVGFGTIISVVVSLLKGQHTCWVVLDCIFFLLISVWIFLINYYMITTVTITACEIRLSSFLGNAIRILYWSEVEYCGKLFVKCTPPAENSYYIVISAELPKKYDTNGTAYCVNPKKAILIEASLENVDVLSHLFKGTVRD